MSTVRKTITLTDQQDLIRREQARAVQLEAVRNALIEGENSGTPQVFDAQAFKQRMRAAHG